MSRIKAGDLKSVFERLEAEARALLAVEGFADDRMRFSRMLDCRYHRQVFSVEVDVAERDLAAADNDWLVRKFEESYRKLYQHSHDEVEGFVDTCRLAAFGIQPALLLKQRTAASPTSAQRGARPIYLGAWVDAPVYWFDDLAAGMVIEGPAVVDSASTSVLIVAGSIATVDRVGSLHIVRSEQR
jgi:N-methylhydantoinase A